MTLKWGIAAAGKISNDFANALSTLSSDEHEIVAVAASNGDRAKQFALSNGIKKSYEGYENLATDPDVGKYSFNHQFSIKFFLLNNKFSEVVYIGALNPQHYEIAMMMLENKKHVLCEKPLCMNEKQARKLITYATSKKLFIMEAVWSRFFPSYQYLKKQIANDILGEIQEVNVTFGFHLADVERLNKKSQGGGTILDLGVYAIQVAQWAFREPPMSVKATGKLNEEGVDLEMVAELTYSGNRKAHLKTSAYEQLENKAYIKGTKGQIVVC